MQESNPRMINQKRKFPEFESCWNRIKNKTDIKTFTKLADIVDVCQSYVSKKKQENIFPPEWAFIIAQKYNLSTDWILTGEFKCTKKEILLRSIDISNLSEHDQWRVKYLITGELF